MPLSPENLLTQLRWRYAVKKFDTGKKVSPEIWRTLEEVLVLSPSSFGLQPWKFIVVKEPGLRQKLRAASWNQSQITDASHLVVFAAKKAILPEDIHHFIQRIADVRKAPVESLNSYKQMILGSIGKAPAAQQAVWASRQTYIALGSFLTAAAVLGIDACPMEGIDTSKYDEILGLNEQGYAALCVATAGYRAVDDPYAQAAKVRDESRDVVAHAE